MYWYCLSVCNCHIVYVLYVSSWGRACCVSPIGFRPHYGPIKLPQVTACMFSICACSSGLAQVVQYMGVCIDSAVTRSQLVLCTCAVQAPANPTSYQCLCVLCACGSSGMQGWEKGVQERLETIVVCTHHLVGVCSSHAATSHCRRSPHSLCCQQFSLALQYLGQGQQAIQRVPGHNWSAWLGSTPMCIQSHGPQSPLN